MIDVIDPSTEEVLDTVPESGAAAVDVAVAAASSAFDTWSRTPLSERLDALDKLAGALEKRSDQLARTVACEMGMPLAQAAAVQVTLPVAVLRATVAVARTFAFEETDGPATIVREPAGVVAAITPWNFPLHQIAAKLAPALAAGCTMVLKPSELAPLNALALADAAAGTLPDGVLTVLTGTGRLTGEPLVRHPGVRVVSLTGSVAAGRRVGALAGEGLKRVTPRARRQVAVDRARRRRRRDRDSRQRRALLLQLGPGVQRADAAARPARRLTRRRGTRR